MDLFDPEESGLLITDISGIGSPGADVNTTDYVTSDGSLFTGTRAKSRQIIMKIQPIDSTSKESIETCRQKTYRYFPIKHNISLTFETDNRTSVIHGYVSKNEPTIFSKSEEIQIDIQCPDPYFYLVGEATSVIFNGVQPMFEFPFSNEKVEDDTTVIHHREYDDFGRVVNEWDETVVLKGTKNLLVMSEVKEDKYGIIDYAGEVDIGVVVTLHARGTVKDPIFYKQGSDNYMLILTDKIEAMTGTPFGEGDNIEISTVSGNRYVRLLRGGSYTNIINALDLNSSWITLNAGMNTISFSAETGVDDLEFKVDYRTAYQGV